MIERPADARFRALVFDFDGTIVDTETPGYESWRTIFAAHGQELSLDRWSARVGRIDHPDDPFVLLESLTGRRLERAAIDAARRRHNRDLIDAQPVTPGIDRWLEDAATLGLPLAIASSSPRDWIEPLLARLGLSGSFAVIAAGDEVAEHKPHPAVYRLAAERLRVAPQRAIAIEDSVPGVRSARAAGLATVAVPSRLTRRFAFDDAHLVVRAPLDTTLAALIEQLSRTGAGQSKTVCE